MRQPRFYRYILRHDDGWAPCIDDGLLSLATCKPAIRRTAVVGDYVAGYQPKAKGEGLLCWFGRVEKIMWHAEYFRAHSKRRDANYQMDTAGVWQRKNRLYHPAETQKLADVSAPALLFDMTETWYFGREPKEPPSSLAPVRAIGQGHRVKVRLPNDVEEMIDWLRKNWPAGILHLPRDESSDCDRTCVPKNGYRKPKAC